VTFCFRAPFKYSNSLTHSLTIKIAQTLSIYNRFKNNSNIETIAWRKKVQLQETIKPNISNKSKNILGVDGVE